MKTTFESDLNMGNDVDVAYDLLKRAWERVAEDYDERKINSERCLQAALYFQFRTLAEEEKSDFLMHVEPTIKRDNKTTKNVVDTIVVGGVNKDKILIAIELKYTPRGVPRPKSVRKDLETLSFIKPRRAKDDRITAVLDRFLDNHVIELEPHSDIRMVFACVYKTKNFKMNESVFAENKPVVGPWGSVRPSKRMPTKLNLLSISRAAGSAKSVVTFFPS